MIFRDHTFIGTCSSGTLWPQTLTSFHHVLPLLCWTQMVNKQAIRLFYNLLNTYNLTPLDLLKNKWETAIDEPISEETWLKIIQGIFSSSICLRHAVIQFKIVYRLHWSKVRLSNIKADIDPCDRYRQATLLHMFWACPKLYTFWQTIL